MKDAFIVSVDANGPQYHIADGVWTPNILKATNYGIGSESHIMDRIRDAYLRERLWAQDHHFHMHAHIGVCNPATGGFIVERTERVRP